METKNYASLCMGAYYDTDQLKGTYLYMGSFKQLRLVRNLTVIVSLLVERFKIRFEFGFDYCIFHGINCVRLTAPQEVLLTNYAIKT